MKKKDKANTSDNEHLLKEMLRNKCDGTITFIIQDGYVIYILRNEKYKTNFQERALAERNVMELTDHLNKGKLRELHPCFGARNNKGRIHLPVCPGCNIECNFCSRKINDYENRPGVASSILTPEEAVETVSKALELCPDITVAGIAGPGDTLASDRTLKTFTLINERFPHLIKCMSTNGLLLNERAEEVIRTGIDTLTVTVNAIDPEIQAKIISGIYYHNRRYEGVEGASILIDNQLEGIRKVAEAGIIVKVNSVLITELNKDHIKEIAKVVSDRGASLYNIIPLIPQHKMAHYSEPECSDIDVVRREAEEYIEVFKHCQRCRADAVGIPGKQDYGDLLYLNRLNYQETFSHG